MTNPHLSSPEMIEVNRPQVQDSFTNKVKQIPPCSEDTWKLSENFGVSNSLQPLPEKKRIYFAGPNLESFPNSNKDGLVIEGVARFVSGAEVFYAFYIQKDIEIVKQRLSKMHDLAEAKVQGYAARNNNGRFVYSIAENRFFLFNGTMWEDADLNDPNAGPSFTVDKIVFAIYPPGKATYQSLAAGEFAYFLKKTFGDGMVEEITPWTEEELSLTPQMQRKPSEVPIDEIMAAVVSQGFVDADNLVTRLHTSLNFLDHKHFVILTGVSGTGKTSLAVTYAHAVHGITVRFAEDPLVFVIPVRPEWTDPTGVTGYYDAISNKYVIPKFLQAVLTATEHSAPVFVCLDEMNLARVEYYFSDVLSAIENRQPINLHSFHDFIEGTGGVPVPPEVCIPENLYVIGTVNIDETTNPISDKVRDRAIIIDTSMVDLERYFTELSGLYPILVPSIDACRGILLNVQNHLIPHNLHFGYRVAEELIRYHYFSTVVGARTSREVIDEQLVQKVLVKLKGDANQRDMLVGLENMFNDQGLSRSREVITRMIDDVDKVFSFQYAS